jgi:hypothetical protein
MPPVLGIPTRFRIALRQSASRGHENSRFISRVILRDTKVPQNGPKFIGPRIRPRPQMGLPGAELMTLERVLPARRGNDGPSDARPAPPLP